MMLPKTSAMLLIGMMLGATAVATSASAQQQSNRSLVQKGSDECADHFSALDANKDDRISPKEDRTVREQIFGALDKNKDDVISREEYVPCLLSNPAFRGVAQAVGKVQVKPVKAKAAKTGEPRRLEQFELVDADGDGRVSSREHMEAAKADYASTGLSYGQSEASAAAGWEFVRMDVDRDGSVTPEEWHGHRDLETVAEAAFKALDGDGDGRVSRQEYDALVDRRYEQASKQVSERREGKSGLSVWNYEYWF